MNIYAQYNLVLYNFILSSELSLGKIFVSLLFYRIAREILVRYNYLRIHLVSVE